MPPAVVREASEAYFAEEDAVTNWIEACCTVDKIYSQTSGELFRSWRKWAEDAGEHPGSNKAFSKSLEERGFKRKHTEHGAMFLGIALRPDDEEEGAASPWWVDR